MDFAAVNRFAIDCQPSRRICPDCGITLQTVRIDTGGGVFAIERCEQCFGLFFDVGEVQAFLDASVSPAFTINLHEITNINEERGRIKEPIRYKKCPECGVLMNRVNYAAMSGVVTDQCKDHGVWLDNGELVHLMEWRKAGGQLLAERKEKQAREERKREIQQVHVPYYSGAGGAVESTTGDLVSTACTILLESLFR
jgi:Zn-finger nucleic acid-binding protein